MTVLTTYIDFKSPAAYLALTPVCELLRRLDLAARWLPLDSRQESVPLERPAETRGDMHRRVRAIARRETHRRYAAVQGLPLIFRESPGSSRLALAALASLEGDPLPFIRAAFRAYWVEGADLDDRETVMSLWQVHARAATFDMKAGLGRLDSIGEKALEQGVFDVPALVVGEQVFIGREHLPWIEELLTSAIAGC